MFVVPFVELLYMIWDFGAKKTAGGFSLAGWDSFVHWPVLLRRRLSKKTFLRRKAIGRAFKVKSTVIILACKLILLHVVFYFRYVFWTERSPSLKNIF
ncbi:MAG: hypothetical protein J6T06_10795 [Victivallales bacterium]|nr:hypothetical protein [Victivallales bacterium]